MKLRLNKAIITVVVVKFRYWVGLKYVEYGHAGLSINMWFISTNKQYPSNIMLISN